MKVSYKNLVVELSIEELTALWDSFLKGVDISELTKIGTSINQYVTKEIETPEEDKPIQDDVIWITTEQLMNEFNFRSNSTIHYHIGKGFNKYRSIVSNGKTYLLFDREAFREWYDTHSNKNAKGPRKAQAKTKKTTDLPKKMEDVIDISTFDGWAKDLRNQCREAGMDPGKAFSAVYRRMTKDYGIVFDQLKKDYKKTTGSYPNSTIEMVYWLENNNPVYGKLFEGILATVINEKEAHI